MPYANRSEELARRASAGSCARRILETVPAVMRLVRSEMRREAGEVLSVPQFRVLRYLGRNSDASLTEVADFIGIANATASAMVERLVRRALVVREADPEERRRVRLRLTGEGSALLERASSRTRRRVAARLSSLKPGDLKALARGLDLLRLTLRTPSEEERES
jgi:MarR family transcriptional regulator for hemolysin